MECWKKVCNLGHYLDCEYEHFYCKAAQRDHPAWWFHLKASNISDLCNPTATNFFHFGIFSDSFASTSAPFVTRCLYCFWWGLRNLRYFLLKLCWFVIRVECVLKVIWMFCFCSSLGQNLLTSSNVGEINFAIVIAMLGLVLFALLIGNMQVII